MNPYRMMRFFLKGLEGGVEGGFASLASGGYAVLRLESPFCIGFCLKESFGRRVLVPIFLGDLRPPFFVK